MSFVHLHLHSEFSLLDGMCRLNQILEQARRFNMPAVALTDHGALYGAFKFYIKSLDYKIKPIIGVEAYKAKKSRFDKQGQINRDQFHLTLLAKNYQGYKNLLKMVTKSHLEGFYYKPRIDFDLLEKYHEGIILLSGCLQGELAQAILNDQESEAERITKKYWEIFGKDFYLEIQRHNQPDEEKVNQGLIKYSRRFGIPLVATNDVHYLNKEDAYAQEVLLCIQTQRVIFEKNRPLSMINVPDFYFKSAEEMKGVFIDLPEAIENTLKIASECDLKIPFGKWILPKFETPEKINEIDYLKRKVEEGKNKIKDFPKDVIDKRISYELEIITKKGYVPYFLIVADFVNWAKNNRIAVGPGRGSVAGSLIAYLLGITEINPLTYNLPFERFLNPERPTPPDIDIDFSDVRRDEVLHYVVDKYGEEKVAQIITFGTMEARLAVRDVARALGLSYTQGDRIAKMIPPPRQGFSMTITQALEESSILKLAYSSEPETKKVIDVAMQIEGLPRHSSVHAAGVVIADKDLTEYVPLQREAKEGKIITQYDMYCLDLNAVSDAKAIGLLKVDFLGLRNLTILENAFNYIKKQRGINLELEKIPLNDKRTFQLISRGETFGVFQLESAGMRRLAKDLKPTKLSDIAAMVALYRPGPMDLIPFFIAGKNNPKKVKYLHPDLKQILSETYGVLVYQEQVMEIAHKIAGYSMSEADNLRMAMGKKKKELMKKEKDKFIGRCLNRGIKNKLAEKIFNFIEKFASYGFNKPHSASYGLIAYWTAFVKANYPVEYMTALLSAELLGVAGPARELKMTQSIEECRRMNIEVLPPDINKSYEGFTIEENSIRFGLSAVKNVGRAAVESILLAREKGEFKSFRDFLYRVDLRKVNKKTVESLIKSGAFSQFGNRATLLSYYPQAVKEVGQLQQESTFGQFSLFSQKEEILKDNYSFLEEFSSEEIFQMEKEVIGFSLTINPLSKIPSDIEKKITKRIGELTEVDVNKSQILVGIISQIKKINTKKNNSEMAFLTIFDKTGSIEVVVFPKDYLRFKDILGLNKLVILKGKITQRDNKLGVILENAALIKT